MQFKKKHKRLELPQVAVKLIKIVMWKFTFPGDLLYITETLGLDMKFKQALKNSLFYVSPKNKNSLSLICRILKSILFVPIVFIGGIRKQRGVKTGAMGGRCNVMPLFY